MSELQPAFAGAVGHCLHPAVILVPAPVEHHAADPPVLRDHRDLLPNFRRLLRLLPVPNLLAGDGRNRATRVVVEGANKELVGQVAAELRSLRPPEPYKGKGIKYAGEQIRRKAGKAGGK